MNDKPVFVDQSMLDQRLGKACAAVGQNEIAILLFEFRNTRNQIASNRDIGLGGRIPESSQFRANGFHGTFPRENDFR